MVPEVLVQFDPESTQLVDTTPTDIALIELAPFMTAALEEVESTTIPQVGA
jgi:hypothetical protein